MKKHLTPKSLIKHLFSLGSGLFLLGLLVFIGGTESLNQLAHMHALPLAGALLTTIGINVSIAGRWGMLANTLAGRRVASWLDYYHYFIISRAMGFVLPKDVTDLGSRTAALNQVHGMSLTQAGASVLFDRLADLLSLCIFLAATLPYWLGIASAQTTFVLMGVFPLVVGVAVVLAHRQFIAATIWLFNSLLGLFRYIPVLRRRSPKRLEATALDRPTVIGVYLWSLLKFGFTAARMVCFALAIGVPIPAALLILGTPPGQLSYLFAFTPGGLGIFEAGWFAILSVAGVASEHVTAYVVGQRLLTLLLIILLALLSQGLYLLRHYRRGQGQPGDHAGVGG